MQTHFPSNVVGEAVAGNKHGGGKVEEDGQKTGGRTTLVGMVTARTTATTTVDVALAVLSRCGGVVA